MSEVPADLLEPGREGEREPAIGEQTPSEAAAPPEPNPAETPEGGELGRTAPD